MNISAFCSSAIRAPRTALRRRCFIADDNGGTIVEWAFMLPLLITFTFVVIDLAMILAINILVEGGLREAARYGITGYVPPGVTREARIRQLVKQNAFGLLQDGSFTISYKVYPSFNDVGKPEPYTDSNGNGQYDAGEPYTDVNGNGEYDLDMGKAGLGGADDIVAYRVSFDWTVLTPFLSPLVGTNGKLAFAATVVVKNEPF